MTRGFTLFEILMYIAVLSFILTGLFTSALYLHDAGLRSKVSAEALLRLLNTRDAADLGTHDL